MGICHLLAPRKPAETLDRVPRFPAITATGGIVHLRVATGYGWSATAQNNAVISQFSTLRLPDVPL